MLVQWQTHAKETGMRGYLIAQNRENLSIIPVNNN